MSYLVDFAGVAGAIGTSVALALWLEWLTLRGLMKFMPARSVEPETSLVPMIHAANERRDQPKAA